MRSEFRDMYEQPILDAVMPFTPSHLGSPEGWRADAGESSFIGRDLEMIEARTYKTKLRPLPFRDLFPVSNEGQGAEQIGYDLIRGTGVAKIIANGAMDLPRSDTFVERVFAVVRSMGISFAYTTKELRNAAFANVPLEARRGDSAQRGNEEKLNDIAWNGDSQYNILGILDNPNITSAEASAPATGTDKTWSGGDKTPFEIIGDIAGAISDIKVLTKKTHIPNTIAIAQEPFEYISKTPYSTLVPKTILSFILDPDNNFKIDKIESVPDLDGSGPGNTDQMLVYERTEEVLEFRIPMEVRAMPPEVRGLEFIINMETEVAGMVVRYPLALSFTYGIG